MMANASPKEDTQARDDNSARAFSSKRAATQGLKSRFRIWLLTLLSWSLLSLIAKTLRWELRGVSDVDLLLEKQGANIFAFWHSRQLLLPWAWHVFRKEPMRTPFYMLISSHSDGRIIAGVCHRQKLNTVAGSSSRGASGAVRTLLEELAKGHHIGITPDGPKGPAEVLKMGVVELSRLGQRPIHPVAISASRAWTFNSWDKMFLPKPFAKMTVVLGPAILVADSEDAEQARLKVEQALKKTTAEADGAYA